MHADEQPFDRRAILAGLGVAGAAAIAARAQAGDLSPPAGPVAPSMKTLDEVRPGTPISSIPFTISQSGVYYLTQNVTGVAGSHGIIIEAQDVTLDLNGFSLIGAPGSLNGIEVSGNRFALEIMNGRVFFWGGDGVGGATAFRSRVRDVHALGNGGAGVSMGPTTQITRCIAESNTGAGIFCGFQSIVQDCQSQLNTNGDGIDAGDFTVVKNCVARDNGGDGIKALQRPTISDCVCAGNTGAGVHMQFAGLVRHCSCDLNQNHGIFLDNNGGGGACQVFENECTNNQGSSGIHADSSGNRIDSNLVVSNASRGIDVIASRSLVVRNVAATNAAGNYGVAVTSNVGRIVTNPGPTFVSSNAWVNFEI